MTFVALATIVPCLAQKPGLVKDEDGYTNLRKGPGTKYEIVDRYDDGSLIYYERGANGWCKVYDMISSDGDFEFRGYMAGNKIVTPKRSGEYKFVGKVKDEDGYTNIRKGPGTKYAIVGRKKDGSFILYSGDYSDRWYKVYKQTGEFIGYLSANKIEAMESPSF